MNPRTLPPVLLLIAVLGTANILIPSVRTAYAERDETKTSMALLELTIVDDTGYALPGVTIEAREMGRGEDTNSFFAVTSAEGQCLLVLAAGAAHVVTASLDGFDSVHLRGVELAGGFSYRPRDVAMGIGEGKARDHRWSDLLTTTPPDEESEFGEWLSEQPDELGAILDRVDTFRVLPLPRDLEVLLSLSFGDWEELAGASIAITNEDHRFFALLDDYGGCNVVLDQPGLYTIRIKHPSVGNRRITDVELLPQTSYIIDSMLESEETTWSEVVANDDVYATTFTGDWIEFEDE